MIIYALEPMYDSRKSFYGKAHIIIDDNGEKTLISYETPVIKIDAAGNVRRLWFGYSVTTARHINEFMQQETGRKCNKATWDKMEVCIK